MIFSFLIILPCLFYLLVSLVKVDRRSCVVLFFASFFYSVLVALKGGSGSDTFEYIRIYNSVLEVPYIIFPFKEVGFYWLLVFLKSNGFSFDAVNYINAFLVFVSIFLLAVKRSPFLVVVYIAFVGINVDFSTIRQSYGIHLFSVFYLFSERMIISIVAGGMFHLSTVISIGIKVLENRLTTSKILIAGGVGTLLCVIFLERYLSQGMIFLVRSSPVFLLQSLVIAFLFYVLGYNKKVVACIFLISILPIGFRFLILFMVVIKFPNSKLKFMKRLGVSFCLLLVLSFKLYSFSGQSIINDGERSTVLKFEELFDI